EYVVSSTLRDPVELRTWMDYVFAKWFLNLPGVAAAEIGGGPLREVIVMPDQRRLAGFGLTIDDLVSALERGNLETAGGRLRMDKQEITGRTAGRFGSVSEVAALPMEVTDEGGVVRVIRLRDVAEVIDSAEDERLRIRLNGIPGVKLAIQKQPQANTVAVVDVVNERLAWLRKNNLIPDDIEIHVVSDEAVFVRQAINNASMAAVSGAILAMIVVFVFLGDLRRTLIIGSAIPIGIMVAIVLMDITGLTLNIMTLGGIALGVGMLVDNTIVMLENVYRNQRLGKSRNEAAQDAAAEVNSAIVASTTTNLAAVLPFLFIGGLIGLLFRELIATISAAIVASLVVALTLVPALGARVPVGRAGLLRRAADAVMEALQNIYVRVLRFCLAFRWVLPLIFIAGLWLALPVFQSGKQVFIPEVDDGRIRIDMVADAGISLGEMDRTVKRVEQLLAQQPDVESLFAQVGGYVFGRSQYEATNRSRISVQLVPLKQRSMSSADWITNMNKEIRKLQLAGVKVRMRNAGIRGFHIGRGDDAVSLRVQGPDLEVLGNIGRMIVERIESVPGLDNVRHSSEDIVQELTVTVDRERAAALGFNVESVGRALRIALEGLVVTDFIEGDRKFDVRLRLPRTDVSNPRDLETILLFPAGRTQGAVYLGDVAAVNLVNSPAKIQRDRQQRIIEVNGNISGDSTLGEVSAEIARRLDGFELPQGYTLYDGGDADVLKKSERLARMLMALALFLVFVVMAVQYESLRNPVVILLSVPFAAIGVALGIIGVGLPLSMPLWLGMIMLAGIVVNNAIVLIEYVEIERERGKPMEAAILSAGRLRLRPILMTTLTTVAGMSPLALALGEGAEMLQPLAIAIVSGLSFSTLVSLVLVPVLYRLLGRRDPVATPA
ncbi:MAG TPA: efflux RND transporter permease subunit, partial [Gammaproteobacteria bacterium]